MLISIIVPAHITADRVSMLKELYDSVPDKRGIELVVIDDHSPKKVPVPEHKLCSVQMLKSNKRYAGEARNLGLQHAKGEYIIFADSDDRFDKNWLQDCIENLHSNQGATWDVAIFEVTSFVNKNQCLGTRHLHINSVLEKVRSNEHPNIARLVTPVGKIIKKSFIEQHKITFSNSKVANDVLFCTRLAIAAPRIQFCQGTGYKIRQDHDSLVTPGNVDNTIERIKVSGQANLLLKENNMTWALYDKESILFVNLKKNIRKIAWALWKTRNTPGYTKNTFFSILQKSLQKIKK